MKQAYEANAIQTTPDLNTLKDGYPTNGNRDQGIAATMPGSAWFYMISQELQNLVQAAKLTPSATNVEQVKGAVIALIDKAVGEIDYSNFVDLTTSQEIEGVKTFKSILLKEKQLTNIDDLSLATTKFVQALRKELFTKNYTYNGENTYTKPINGANATKGNQLTTLDQVNSIVNASAGVPTGTLIAYAATQNVRIPTGFLLCNGVAVSRTTYKNLFACIGTTYGAGDGKTTFTLPDFRGRFIEGATTAGARKNAGLPNITGTWAYSFALMHSKFTGAYVNNTSAGHHGGEYYDDGNCKAPNFDASKSNKIYGSSTTVQPQSITSIIIIKI